jgi:hypothetical protein
MDMTWIILRYLRKTITLHTDAMGILYHEYNKNLEGGTNKKVKVQQQPSLTHNLAIAVKRR